MPLIDLTYPAGSVADEQRAALVDELTTVLLRAERAPETEFFRSIAWVHVHELPGECVMAAGRPVAEPTFRIQVTIPEGALSDRRKQEFVAEATRVVLEATGIDDPSRVWAIINEVPDGNWGAGGQIVRYADLVRYAREEREQPGPAAATSTFR
jgi:4-oxalocrotonate tautomerase family enzyme